MDSSLLLRFTLLAPIVILGLECFVISAAILLRSQPLVLNGRVLAWVLILSVIPINAGIVYLIATAGETAVICYGVFVVLIQVIAYSAVIRAMRGIFILGVSAEGCRTALREVLGELGLPAAETILGFDFTEQAGRAQVAIARQLGTAQLRLVDVEDTLLLRSIGRQLKAYFRKNHGDFFLQTVLIYGASGIAALLLAAYQWSRFYL